MEKRINKIILTYISVIFICFVILILINSCGSSALNYNINGGFEYSDSGNMDPDGWFPNRLPALSGNVEFKLDKRVAHSGGKSISISILKPTPGKSNLYNWVRNVEGLVSKKIYELSGWIKTNKINNSPFVEIQCWNRSEDKLIAKTSTLNHFPVVGTTKDWQQVKVLFNVPAGTTKILVLACVPSSGNNGGKVWFDDIELKKL